MKDRVTCLPRKAHFMMYIREYIKYSRPIIVQENYISFSLPKMGAITVWFADGDTQTVK